MNSIHGVSPFGPRFFIFAAVVLVVIAVLALNYQAGVEELNTIAVSKSDDLFNGDLGREILNK